MSHTACFTTFEGGGGDGYYPYAGLTNIKGTFYSTTQDGGVNFEGAVFSVTPSGTETMLHSFGGSGDGTYPFAGLINVHGTLYGTTETGGANSKGTVFSITPSGAETVLHSFGGSGDGAYPCAGLLDVKGTLYSTTNVGGANNLGTIFSITPSGTETVVYSFKGGSGDGEYPFVGSLINVRGKLYDMTVNGGTNNEGTVFSVTPSGKEKVLHSFKGGSETANSRMRISSTSRARSTAPPMLGVRVRAAATHLLKDAAPSSRSRDPAGKLFSTASKAARETASFQKLASSTSRGHSTARRCKEAGPGAEARVAARSSR